MHRPMNNESVPNRPSALGDVQKKKTFFPFLFFQRISHPNIVSVYNIFEIENTVFIFMELCEQGDLLDYIRNKGALPEHRAKHFFR